MDIYTLLFINSFFEIGIHDGHIYATWLDNRILYTYMNVELTDIVLLLLGLGMDDGHINIVIL